MRKAIVTLFDRAAGEGWEDENGFHFRYLPDHLMMSGAQPVSLTLPLSDKTYSSDTILPFFDGLIPEGWLLGIAEQYWKISSCDRPADDANAPSAPHHRYRNPCPNGYSGRSES